MNEKEKTVDEKIEEEATSMTEEVIEAIEEEAVATSEEVVEKMIAKLPTMEELEESLSPLEKELLALLRKEKAIPFFELNKMNHRFLGAIGKLTQRRFAKKIKDMKKQRSERNILVLIEEKATPNPQSSTEAN